MTFFGPNGRARGRVWPLCPPPSLSTPLIEGHTHWLAQEDQRILTEKRRLFVIKSVLIQRIQDQGGVARGGGTFCPLYLPCHALFSKPRPPKVTKNGQRISAENGGFCDQNGPISTVQEAKGRGSGRGTFLPSCPPLPRPFSKATFTFYVTLNI